VIDIKVDRFPIVILANFRTGSSALADHLGNKYSIPVFSEPFTNSTVGSINRFKVHFMKTYKNSSNYVVKFMGIQINDLNPYEKLLDMDSYRIRLSRRDKVAQISSLYIAQKRSKFFKYIGDTTEKYYLPIDRVVLLDALAAIMRNDFYLRKLPYSYSLDLEYEDLGFIEDTKHVLSDNPENIEEIREEIRKILRWKDIFNI